MGTLRRDEGGTAAVPHLGRRAVRARRRRRLASRSSPAPAGWICRPTVPAAAVLAHADTVRPAAGRGRRVDGAGGTAIELAAPCAVPAPAGTVRQLRWHRGSGGARRSPHGWWWPATGPARRGRGGARRAERGVPLDGSTGRSGLLSLLDLAGRRRTRSRRCDARTDAPLWLATRGAVSVAPPDPLTPAGRRRCVGPRPGRRTRTAPPRWGGLVDLPAALDERAADRLVARPRRAGAEDQVALRASGVRPPAGPRAGRAAGGAVAAGRHRAGHRRHRRARRAGRPLARRRAPSSSCCSAAAGEDAPGAAELAAELGPGRRSSPATSRTATPSPRSSASCPRCPRCHAAGVARRGGSGTLTPARARRRPAGQGAAPRTWTSCPDGARRRSCCSPRSRGVGRSGQGAYAAANAYLDALAEHRRARRPARDLDRLGSVGGDGMAARDRTRPARRAASRDAPELAISALRRALDRTSGRRGGRRRLGAVRAASRRPPEPAAGRAGTTGTATRRARHEPSASCGGSAALTAADGERALDDLVRGEAAAVLGHGSPTPSSRTGRSRSSASTRSPRSSCATGCQAPTGLSLPATAGLRLPDTGRAGRAPATSCVAGAPTCSGRRRAGRDAGRPDRDRRHELPVPRRRALAGGPVAAGRRGRRRDRRLPRRPRLGPRRPVRPGPGQPGHSYTRAGGFLYDAAEFDAGVLRDLAARGARDGPAAAAAAGDVVGGVRAGRDRPALAAGQPTPACSPAPTAQDYGPRLRRGAGGLRGLPAHRQRRQRHLRPGRLHVRAGGPGGHRRHACSSSLVALHLAAQALRQGECSLALAGGVDRDVDARRRSSSSAGSAGCRGRPLQVVRRRRPTAPAGARAPACCCWSGCPTRGATATGARGGARLRGQPGRRVERADRAERPVAAAGDPRRRSPTPGWHRPMWTRWRRTAPAPRSATRSRRRRCWRRTGRTGSGRCGWVR